MAHTLGQDQVGFLQKLHEIRRSGGRIESRRVCSCGYYVRKLLAYSALRQVGHSKVVLYR